MPVTVIPIGDAGACCGVCRPPSALLKVSPSIAFQQGEAYANASPVQFDSQVEDIIAAHSYDPADFAGFFREINLDEAFLILSTEDSESHGYWHRRTTTRHTGPDVVDTAEEIDFELEDNSDDEPAAPLFASLADFVAEESDLSVIGVVDPEDIRARAAGNASSAEYQASILPFLILNGYGSGVAVDELGHGYAQRKRILPARRFLPDLGYTVESYTNNPPSHLPVAWTQLSYDVESEEATSVPQGIVTVYFVAGDWLPSEETNQADPETAGWIEVPFDDTGGAYHDAEFVDGDIEIFPFAVVDA
jgi:hypothetical protein